MIWTVFRISALRLWNNKHELALAFIVPVLFFTIFALIFSRGVGQSLSRVRVSFVDDDRTPESLAIIQDACEHPEIRQVTGIGHTTSEWPIQSLSRWLISRRDVEVVVHIPSGFTGQNPDHPTLSIALHNEGINPIGHRLVQASLAEAIALQFAEANMQVARRSQPQVSFASASKRVTPAIQEDIGTVGATQGEPTVFQSVNAFADNKSQPKVAMFAAGIAVMFLLFSANGAGASLLEEREAGTLGRLLSSRLSLSELLLGKWLYITVLGCLQLSIMFIWGDWIFGVSLHQHLPGFVAITGATAAACSSFALFLAALCQSRQQLHGVSVVLVLSMSAVGGSMVPRYIMSDGMRSLGKFTFNGWALDGFQKIFWYDMPLNAIRVELCVLLGMATLLGLAARLLASRWSCT